MTMVDFRIAAMAFALSTTAALAQDVGAGETAFRKCRGCHAVGADASNTIGPMLNGIDGRKCGSVAGYNYSTANRNCAFRWAETVFVDYVRDPRLKLPGTKKSFSGIKDEAEARDLWAYLRRFRPDGRLE
jgi:cytochrome c